LAQTIPTRRVTTRAAPVPEKPVQFDKPLLPWLFLLPQLAVIVIFFYWPSVQAVTSSFYIEDPFGFGSTFVGTDNYTDALGSGEYRSIAGFTAFFTTVVTGLSLSIGLLLAIKADAVIRGSAAYKTLLISVYAIAAGGRADRDDVFRHAHRAVRENRRLVRLGDESGA